MKESLRERNTIRMNRLFIAKNKELLFDSYTKEQIKDSIIISNQEFYDNQEKYKNIEYIFSTWGMPNLTEEEIEKYLPNLKAVFYAAGSVRPFGKPFLNRGIKIFSAWQANAIPVAEFLVAQIVLANKGFFQLYDRYKQGGYEKARSYARSYSGNYQTKVGFLGVGMITRHAIELLKVYDLEIFVYSNHLSVNEAEQMGVKKASLAYIFENCQTISNNMANIEKTKNLINQELLGLMKENATFINTGRGAQVNLMDLIQVMREKPNATAILDVTDPLEPMPLEHEVWDLPNIVITPHVAGSFSKEILRMGVYMMEEHRRFVCGEETSYEVTEDLFETMA